MIRSYISKVKGNFIYIYNKFFLKKKSTTDPLKLHLGCGNVYLNDYVNIDLSSDSLADVVSDFKDIYKLYPKNSVSEILMVHSISYLRLWEAKDFFNECHYLLKEGGKLLMEFPDIEKCAVKLTKSKNDYPNYIEAIRGVYAFDLDQIKKKESFYTYPFGWSAWHIELELKKTGFNDITCSDGLLHDNKWRDTRVEAIK
jgi:hypothetical protein